jgi:protein arginine kinase activator
MNMCEECGAHPANIHLTQIVENETQSFHLCEDCARKRGINISIDEEAMKAETLGIPFIVPEAEVDPECIGCGMKLSEFRDKGLLGCSDCYASFEREIEAMLMQTNGSTEHKGKRYGKAVLVKKEKTDVSRLRSELDAAIKNEEFERAAKLRDAIHQRMGAEAP